MKNTYRRRQVMGLLRSLLVLLFPALCFSAVNGPGRRDARRLRTLRQRWSTAWMRRVRAVGEEHSNPPLHGRLCQNSTPLVDALRDVSSNVKAPFFVPGHKMGRSAPTRLSESFGRNMQDIFRFDLTEIPGLDNLADPEDVIMLSERLAAEAFGAKKTFFLVNGSTSGIIASIMACVAQFRRKNPTFRGNPKIVLPRSVHKSAIHALVVSGAVPLWIWPDYDEEFHIAYPITPSTLESAMQEHQDIAGVIIVSPSYHGVISDIAGISRVCDGLDVPLVVDEAHGAHLNAFRARTGISSATVLGADAVVQSTHKCLSSLTQSAMLHVPPNSRLDVSVIQESLPLVQSSSPNYLLMASLDAARWQFSQPEMAGSDLPEISQVAHEKLAAISGLEVFGHPGIGNDQPGKIIPTINPGNSADPILIDPTRITILTRKLGISGFEFAQKLEENGGVYCELASERHVTLALSLGNNLAHIETLVKEASSIAKEARVRANNCDRTTAKDQNRLPEPSKREAASIPPITPREAFLMPTETLSAADAAGQLCAETICPYPPGIPVIVPGELITQDTIERLQRLRDKGASIVGARDATLQTFQVLVANLEQDMA